ncbi:sensor domain-containing diguanylate cyclase [Marinobacteraceae bacterium S3BR75-40.1]
MAAKQDSSDFELLERLQLQAERLDMLKARIAELEKDCDQLQTTTSTLSEEIEQYHHIKQEWDWFFNNSLDMLVVAGYDGYFKRVNPAFTKTLGYEAGTLLSKPLIEFVHPDDVDHTIQELQQLEQGLDSVNFENRYLDAEGEWHWLSWQCPALRPNTDLLYAIARDVTASKRNEADMLYRAQHDALTDLLNRAAFEQEVEGAIARVERQLTGQLALFLIDLDHFKPINDTYGHAAGDQTLRQLASRFKEALRRHEFIARLGGDEFGWLAEAPSGFEIGALAERILATVREPILLEEGAVSLDCCIGIATFPGTASSAEELFLQADKAMYSAKRAGKGRYLQHLA